MSAPEQSQPPDAGSAAGAPDDASLGGDAPVNGQIPSVRPLPAPRGGVLPERRPLGAVFFSAPSSLIPLAQAAVVAAGSFAAGAAIAGLAHRRRRRSELRPRPRASRRPRAGARRGGSPAGAAEQVQIVATRSLLVDVHLLGEH